MYLNKMLIDEVNILIPNELTDMGLEIFNAEKKPPKKVCYADMTISICECIV